ncbi:MAG: hypothetical protein WA635_13600, partial [Gallionella sp.]
WSSIYSIFERLNTGGISLQPQEIRMALYHGPFSALLRELNAVEEWRRLIGPVSRRLKDVELILRFFALLFYHGSYRRPMKDFLNRYMATNKTLSKQPADQLRQIFSNTSRTILTVLGEGAFRPERGVNAALVDALMVGVGTAIQKGGVDHQKIIDARATLLKDKDFIDSISTGTSQKPKVDLRIAKTIAAIGG